LKNTYVLMLDSLNRYDETLKARFKFAMMYV